MKKLIYGVAVAVLAMVSCAKEIQDPTVQEFGSTGTHSLSVGIEAGAYQAEDETKASMNPVVRVAWKDGDKVSVVNATTQTVLGGYLEADPQDANGYIATFSGTVTGTINEGDVLYYIYPALENAPSTEGGFGEYAISLQNQKYDTNNTGDVCFYGYAQDIAGANPGSISKKIQFNLVTAYVHLNMSNLPAAGTSLTSIDLSNVNGGFKWAMNQYGVLSAKPYLENKGISVVCTNTNISKSGNAIVRFAVPASPEIEDANIARVLTVNKAYTNSNYSKAKRNAAAYYNQLYSSWQSNNVTVEDKGTEVEVKIDNGGSTESAEGILPVAETFKSDKPASISMGGVGTITFDKTATAKILDNAEDAGSTNVFFKVEDVTETKPVQNANIVYEVTMKTVDENGVEVFSTDKAAGVATVVVPLDDNVESVQSVSLVKDDGTPIEGGVVEESVKFEKPNLTFQVNHFSKYAIKYTLSETQIDPVALIGERKYATLEGAVAAVQHGQTITLIKDVELENPIVTDKTFTLTLNANISPVSTWEGGGYKDGVIIIKRGGNLTINGSGKILNNGVEKAYAAVKMTQKEEPDGAAAKLTVGGTVTLEGYYYGIVGGGTRHNTEITINGGTIKGCNATDCQGIYHPQDGKLTINGGTISGYNSAIELRGGTLEINGGTLTSTASPLDVDPNGSGSTTKGAALAIAQHTTKKDINVTVNGGTFNGYKAISVTNPQNNKTDNVEVTYKAGTLNGGITLGHGIFNLTGNLAVKEPVKVIGKMTLNLGTSKLSAASGFTRNNTGVIIINRKGDLTVEGTTGSIESAGNVYTAITLTEKTVDESDTTVPAKLTVDGGNLIGWYYAIAGSGNTNRKNTSIVINGGTVTTGEEGGAAIYHPQNGTLTINGGTIESATGIYVKSGSVTTEVTGGIIKGTGEKEDYETTTSGMQSTGDAIVFDNCDYPGGAPNAAIKGGYFYSANASAIGSYAKTGKEPITGFISGGLFSSEPAADLIVEGKAAIDNTDESTKATYPWTVGELQGVAKIGTTGYATLADAVAAVQNGQTITLIKDVVLENPIETDKTFTLTLNADITPIPGWQTNDNTTDAIIIIRRGGNITINGTGMISSNGVGNAYSAVKLTNKDEAKTGTAAKLTVDGTVTLEGYYYGICGNGTRHDTEITINGGTIKGIASNDNIGIFHPQGGLLTINGGKIEGSTGIALKGGKLVVNGGTINGNGVKADFKHNGSGWNNTGDALAVEVCDYPGQNPPQNDLSVEIKGGEFSSTYGEAVAGYVQPQTEYTPLTGFISGGLFSTKPEADLIVAGKAVVENQEESTKTTYPWTIGERPNVAKIGDIEYATLAEAFKAVPTDAAEATTITIINNANETFDTQGAKLNKGQKAVLDLNGYKLVGTSTKVGYTQYIYVENGGELTVKDSRTGGAIEYHDGYIENLTSGSSTGGSAITCHGCMTLVSGTIENKTPDTMTNDLEGAIDMYTNAWGEPYSPADIVLNINGGVVKSNNANTVRLTSFSAQSYTTSVTVNMNGGEVYGRDGFFIQGVSESYLNTNTLNLNGGKVYGTQAVRVMAFQNHENTSESKPVTIKIGEGVELTNNYFAQSTKTGWSEDICIDNLQGSFEQLLSYVNIIVEGGGSLCCENRFNVI